VSAVDSAVGQEPVKGRHHRAKRTLPPSRMKFRRHPISWVIQKAKGFGHKGIWTYILTLVAACIYWLITQTNDPVHSWWHETVPDDTTRHLYRAALEAVAASFAVRIIGYDHYRAVKAGGMGWFRRFVVKRLYIAQPGDGETLTLGQALWCVLVWLLLVAGVSVALVLLVTKGLHISLKHQDTVGYTLPAHPTFGNQMEYSAVEIINNWPLKMIVFGSGLAGGWIIKGIADDIQVFFIQLRRRHGRKLSALARKLYPTAYVDRYDELCSQSADEIAEFSTGSSVAIRLMVMLTAVFAVVGWFAVNSKLPHV
jgi:hypothetical protein